MLQGECRGGGVVLAGTAKDFKSSSAELACVLFILEIQHRCFHLHYQ